MVFGITRSSNNDCVDKKGGQLVHLQSTVKYTINFKFNSTGTRLDFVFKVWYIL